MSDKYEMPWHFLEFPHAGVAAMSATNLEAAYSNAFKADPVNGFRFGYHLKHLPFAGMLFKKLQQLPRQTRSLILALMASRFP